MRRDCPPRGPLALIDVYTARRVYNCLVKAKYINIKKINQDPTQLPARKRARQKEAGKPTTSIDETGSVYPSSTTITMRARNGSQQQRGNRPNNPPAQVFHPKLITAQIITLQCWHYALLAFLIQVNHVLYKTSITIDRIFTDKYVRLWHTKGWPDVLAIIVASLFG